MSQFPLASFYLEAPAQHLKTLDQLVLTSRLIQLVEDNQSLLGKAETIVNLVLVDTDRSYLKNYCAVNKAHCVFVVLLDFSCLLETDESILKFSGFQVVETEVEVALGSFGVLGTAEGEGVHQ